ncbi:RHS repeat protein [Pontibacter sp. Tf4]|uniref:RHS repeat domain-containing protein n=1 Tax=Pontibacter sp. Tf4 TaxID=2761620 RepID=UPI00162622E1|nr:RHS repeat domain-containing protein [Pontibacter sp. Tf4]MBB6612559.1 RHS repeat protein [Pontibacter sp. Tf4]
MNRLLLLLLLISLNIPLLAQNQETPLILDRTLNNLQSPNATSLEMFGEIPVSFFTGLPSIDIPLYTIQDAGITLPISLSYHASGVSPDQHPGWVGMGWNLNAGGAISRQVNDLPDEYNNTDPQYSLGSYAGFYFQNEILDGEYWDYKGNVEFVARSLFYKDTEPDAFSFNFLGYSGKFYWGADGTWKVKCNKPVKVDIIASSAFLDVPFEHLSRPTASGEQVLFYPKTFSGFTLTTEDGTIFVFGGNTDAIEYSMDFFNQNNDLWTADTWYLTKIIKNGHEISLDYDRGSFIAQMYTSLYQLVSVGNGTCPPVTNLNLNEAYQGKLITPVYLASIVTPNSTVYFELDNTNELRYGEDISDFTIPNPYFQKWNKNKYPYGGNHFPYLQRQYPHNSAPYTFPECLQNLQWKQLQAIRIENKERLIKSLEFTYSNSNQQRLTLLEVQERDAAGNSKPPYKFNYRDINLLPPYLAHKTDHWGFFNGRQLPPEDNVNPVTYFGYREPTSDKVTALAGMLKQITYPTGGTSVFEFEQHDYSKHLKEDRTDVDSPGFNKDAGGVRIWKISSYSTDDPTLKLEKEYFYVSGYNSTISDVAALPSSGVLGGQSRYLYDDYEAKAFNSPATYKESVFSSQSILPASSNSQGSHIGYSEVVEKRSDGSYTIYYYSNFDNGRLDEVTPVTSILQPTKTLYDPYSSNEEQRGKLVKEEQFNFKGDPVKLKEIEYIAFNKLNEYARSLKARNFIICNEYLSAVEEGTPYKFYTYSYLPIKETETIYDVNGLNPIVTTKKFTYNNQKLLAEQSVIDSKGQTHIAQFKYPFDYNNSSILKTLYKSSYDKCMLFTTPDGDTENKSHTCELEASNVINQAVANNPIPLLIKKMQDAFMPASVIEELSWIEKGSIKRLTGATFNQYKDYGATAGGIQLQSVLRAPLEAPLPSTDFTVSHINSDYQFMQDARYEVELNLGPYDDKGNLLHAVKQSDLTDSFLWGYNKTLPIARVQNALPSQVFHTSFEDSGTADEGAKTGSRYHIGNFTFTPPADFTPLSGSKLSYYSWSSATGKWTWEEEEYTGGNVTCYGERIDEVRITPPGALMTTYTYDLLVGMTSSTDANGRTTYYEYDGFGRLQAAKDDQGQVLKTYQYHYKGQ